MQVQLRSVLAVKVLRLDADQMLTGRPGMLYNHLAQLHVMLDCTPVVDV